VDVVAVLFAARPSHLHAVTGLRSIAAFVRSCALRSRCYVSLFRIMCLGVKLCAPTADVTGRPVPTAVSETLVRFVCADLQNLSFCQRAFVAKLVCRDLTSLLIKYDNCILHLVFVVIIIYFGPLRMQIYVQCVVCCLLYVIVCMFYCGVVVVPLSFCSFCLYGFVSVVSS